MTTAVRILIEGNKACVIRCTEGGVDTRAPMTVPPGEYCLHYIHGEQTLSVKETGDFVS